MNKKIVIISITAILFLGIAVGAIFFVQKDFKKGVQAPVIDVVSDIENCSLIKITEDTEWCLANGYQKWLMKIQYDALEKKDPALCEKIPSQDIVENCYLTVIGVIDDSAVCEKFKDAGRKEECKNKFIVRKASLSECKTIANEVDRDYCIKNTIISSEGAGSKLCETLQGEDQSQCWEIYYTQQAIVSSDYFICSKIQTAEGRNNCLKKLPDDTDKDKISDIMELNVYATNSEDDDSDDDSLNDYDEIYVHKTDPLKSDTDGDGYNDGEEIKTGHNPLGK